MTKTAGVFNADGRAMSAVATDLNDDGYPDIFVANDAMANYYYENTGKGTFEEKAVFNGLAYGEYGQGVSSMGPAVADVDALPVPGGVDRQRHPAGAGVVDRARLHRARRLAALGVPVHA